MDLVTSRLAHLATLPFTTVTLIGLVAAVLTAGALGRTPEAQRPWLLSAASALVLGLLVGPSVTAAWLVYALVFYVVVEYAPPGIARSALILGLLGLLVAAPVWWIAALGEVGPRVRELTAFATNVALLRFWAYAWDRRERGERPPRIERYLAAMLFFPTFTNGPIEPERSFPDRWPRPTWADVRAGLGRVGAGVAKLLVLGLVFAPGWISVLETGPSASWGRLWWWAIQLYVWFYLSFAAWSDVAIGFGRMTGRRVQENFDRPWLALDVRDFWRRWHVSLGLWLRDYVYIPLGGNRHGRVRNVALTFLVSALWHIWGTLKLLGFGYYPMHAWGGFLVWGLLHALAIILIGRPGLAATAGMRAARRLATFAFASWAWVPFFLPASVSIGAGLGMLLHMLLPVG